LSNVHMPSSAEAAVADRARAVVARRMRRIK